MYLKLSQFGYKIMPEIATSLYSKKMKFCTLKNVVDNVQGQLSSSWLSILLVLGPIDVEKRCLIPAPSVPR